MFIELSHGAATPRSMGLCYRAVCLVGLWAALAAPALAGDWRIEGELRARYETLDGQFRQGLNGSDQAIFTRALILAEWQAERWAVGAEIQDSRSFLDDSGTPLSGGFVNAGDLLQAYVRLNSSGLLGASSTGATTFGRQTVSISSKRQVERVSYANVIRTFTGVHHISTSDDGDLLHLFAVVPVSRDTGGREGAGVNTIDFDEEEWDRKFLGAHYRRKDALPGWASDIWGEVFVYGLFEQDSTDFQGPNRQYVYPGFRLYRQKKAGQWDLDWEPSIRLGTRRRSNAPDDQDDLDVRASRVIAIAGYTWDMAWQPRFALEWYWASGDKDPDDGTYERYERLFGSRRTDLNNTSLHGPLTYANLNAPGFRIEVTPSDRFDARLAYSASSLASDTDSFQIARLRDTSGRSGTFTGHAWDGRIRYMPRDGGFEYELGFSAFSFGEFTKNAPGGPQGDRTLFGYLQATYSF